LFEVFNLAQQSNEDGVEVDLEQSVLFVFAALIICDKEMFQFLMGVFVDLFFPQSDFAFLVVFDNFEDVLIEFVHVFVLLSFSDALAQGVNFLERFGDAVFEGAAPGESSCDGWVVVVDGRFLVVAVDELFAFQEDGLDGFEVLFEHVQQDCVFLFEFVLDDGAVEDALEAVEQFEFAHDGVVVVETLGHHGGQSAFQFFDLSAEDEEIFVELLLVDVHGVVGEGSEVLHGFLELFRDLFEGFGEGLALGASELYPF
jgi:hypothetical protein